MATCAVDISASISAEISGRSPRKLFIFYFPKKYFLDQSIQKMFFSLLKTEALVGVLDSSSGR